jgi:GntR family transcriptional regulator
MLLRVQPESDEPIFAQIVRQVRVAVAGGGIRPGEKLPSHRDLAAQLVINHLTVKRAFDELEREGLIVTRRGLGTFVADAPPATAAETHRSAAAAALERAAADARGAGWTRAQWLDLAAQAWKETR